VEVRVERDGGSEVANLQSWYRAVRQRRLADPSLEDGIAAVLPIFAAEKAAIERRTVRLNELFDESARASSKLNA
jgi:hypothetical protein